MIPSWTDVLSYMSLGLVVWLFSYGMNRIWLTFKKIVS